MNNNLYDVIEHGLAVSELVVDEFTSECVTLPPELCVEKGRIQLLLHFLITQMDIKLYIKDVVEMTK